MTSRGSKEPPVPAERSATLRRQMIELLQLQALSARELSQALGLPEKQVYGHLEHIRHGCRQHNRLRTIPAVCKKCRFAFTKRQRLQKPGKCPVCRGEAIEEPRFTLLPGS